MPKPPQDQNDDYEPADIDDQDSLDEDERRRLREETEDRAVRREILLGQLAMARSDLYAAEEQGDQAKIAELRQTIADLTTERNGL